MIQKHQIIIRPISNRKFRFVASYHDNFMESSYWVCFADSITGSLVLNSFYQMIKTQLNNEAVTLTLSDKCITFQNTALLDEVLELQSIE